MEEFLNELLTFIDKKTDWKVNNDTTNSQVINEFLYRNKELTAQFITSVGKPVADTESGLHLADVSKPKGTVCKHDLYRSGVYIKCRKCDYMVLG